MGMWPKWKKTATSLLVTFSYHQKPNQHRSSRDPAGFCTHTCVQHTRTHRKIGFPSRNLRPTGWSSCLSSAIVHSAQIDNFFPNIWLTAVLHFTNQDNKILKKKAHKVKVENTSRMTSQQQIIIPIVLHCLIMQENWNILTLKKLTWKFRILCKNNTSKNNFISLLNIPIKEYEKRYFIIYYMLISKISN